MSSGMTLIPLGVGDAFSALHYSSCMTLEADGALLLVDCPHPIMKMMREAGLAAGAPLTADRVAAVVLTHLHADHCSGLEDLAYYFHYTLSRTLPVLAHPAVAERLWDGHLAAGMELVSTGSGRAPQKKKFTDFFRLIELSDKHAASFGPFSVECRRTEHHVPTTALRVTGAGRCLGHSADTSFDPSLIEWLARADLVLHETGPGIHTPYEKLAALPAAVRGKMKLTHFSDAFDGKASVIEPLRQGQRYSV